jgi:hypothetical protein
MISRDPSYFYWSLRNDVFKGDLGLEIARVAERAKAILPPSASRDKVFSAEYDGAGELLRIRLVSRDEELRNSHGKRRIFKYFPLVLAARRMSRGSQNVLASEFRRIYYGAGDTTAWRSFCQRFFLNESNFETNVANGKPKPAK